MKVIKMKWYKLDGDKDVESIEFLKTYKPDKS